MGYLIDDLVFVAIGPIRCLFFDQGLALVLEEIYLFLLIFVLQQILKVVSDFQGLLVYSALYFAPFLAADEDNLILRHCI